MVSGHVLDLERILGALKLGVGSTDPVSACKAGGLLIVTQCPQTALLFVIPSSHMHCFCRCMFLQVAGFFVLCAPLKPCYACDLLLALAILAVGEARKDLGEARWCRSRQW